MPLVIHMIGNAHIDPVWLWNWPAGVDEALASFRSAADRCEEYPEFIYTRGEAWLYQQVETLDPELFERVGRLIERGQWHVTGGQYLQPDCNLPSLEGWRRQIEHGQRYFQDRFGVQPKVGYNVDSFGHPGTLPAIYSEHAYEGYVFHRPNAKQQELPAQTFRWRSGGDELLGFRISPAYVTRTDDLYGQIMLAAEAADPQLGHTMCFYGVGNHGGGPTKANIEYILEHARAFDGLELQFSTPEAFFGAVKGSRDSIPVLEGELQGTFPGCYSVMHDVKQAQRHGEHLLVQAATMVDCFELEECRAEKAAKIDKAWEDLLFTQFHDILAGTSIPSAWPSIEARQGRARIEAEEVVTEVSRRWSRRTLPAVNQQQLVILNSMDSAWSGWLETEPFLDFDAWGDRWLSDLDGNPVDFQRIQPESPILLSNRILFPADVPARGHLQLLVRDDSRPDADVASDLEVSPTRIANRHLRVELGSRGIDQIFRANQALLDVGGLGLHLRQDSTDTWTFHADRFTEAIVERFEGEEWVVEEEGPLRARARLEGHLGHSWLRLTVSLYRDDPRLYLKMDVTFNERYRLLQMPIHLAQQVESWQSGQAGGVTLRRPGPVEWPVQGWSQLDLPGGAVALLSQDAYSLSLDEGCWQWTLLRSPRAAWGGGQPDVYVGHDHHTDQGSHSFDFVLNLGERMDVCELEAEAARMVQIPLIFDRYEGMNRPPWGNNPRRRLWTGSEQRARQDGRMMHLRDNDEEGVEEGNE